MIHIIIIIYYICACKVNIVYALISFEVKFFEIKTNDIKVLCHIFIYFIHLIYSARFIYFTLFFRLFLISKNKHEKFSLFNST